MWFHLAGLMVVVRSAGVSQGKPGHSPRLRLSVCLSLFYVCVRGWVWGCHDVVLCVYGMFVWGYCVMMVCVLGRGGCIMMAASVCLCVYVGSHYDDACVCVWG